MEKYIVVFFVAIIFNPMLISIYMAWFNIPFLVELKGNFSSVTSPEYTVQKYRNGIFQKQFSEYFDKQNKIKDIYIYI